MSAVHGYADRIEVTVQTLVPGAGCAVAAAFTYPVQAVAIPRTTLPIRVIEEVEVTPCDS